MTVAGPVGGDEDGPIRIDAEMLERLRRSGFRIDADGEFQHEGEPVRHEGLRRALFRWLDSLPDGRVILRLDSTRFAYVDVDDTPLVVRAARIEGDKMLLALSDGAEEALVPASLNIDDAGVMRCSVRNGRLTARLATSAATVLAELMEEDDEGAPVLNLAGQRHVLKREERISSAH